MSALGYLGATQKNADVAGQTGQGLTPGEKLTMATPSGNTGIAEAAHTIAAGVPDIESLWGGGVHPEMLTNLGEHLVAPATGLEQATDSVEGKLGGLVPRLKSTVAPGPAGGAAQARSTLDKGLKRLGL